MTDGILLAELQRDRQLTKYDTIIIDEAHERSLNIDFLLGYLRRLLPKRPDLKLIITSATIDPERFAEHFADRHGKPAPIIEVSGRTFPVDIRYRPLVELPEADEDGEAVVRDQTEAIVDAVKELSAEGPGDILVFLPGEREIRDTADVLRDLNLRNPLEVVPLYSRLSAAEQHKVFSSHTGRRVVLATNVAETSLTVPGIRYVVDTGVARISRYSARTKVQRLPIEPISQASANQRSGRCGRVEAGIAVRLYSEEDFAGPSGVHRPGDPAHQPRLGHPADDLAGARRGRPLPVRRAAGPAQHHRRRAAARGARRDRRRQADPGRSAARPAPARPAAGPDDPRGRGPRLRPRGAGDRRRALAAGPARAPGRAAGPGRPAARPLQGRGQRLPRLAQPVALPQGAAEGAQQQRLPPDVQARVPQLPAGARVAGLRVPAAPGLQGDEGRPRPARRQPGRRRHPPGAALRPALAHRPAAGGRDELGHRTAWAARLPRRPRGSLRDLPGQRPGPEEPRSS